MFATVIRHRSEREGGREEEEEEEEEFFNHYKNDLKRHAESARARERERKKDEAGPTPSSPPNNLKTVMGRVCVRNEHREQETDAGSKVGGGVEVCQCRQQRVDRLS